LSEPRSPAGVRPLSDFPEEHVNQGSVIDLLASWGATADPVLGQILLAIDSFREDHVQPSGQVDLPLRRLAESASRFLPVDLNAELDAFLASRSSTSRGAGVEDLHRRICTAISCRRDETAQHLARELSQLAILLTTDELERLVSVLWRASESRSPAEQTVALAEMASVEASLKAGRETRISTLRLRADRLSGDGPEAAVRESVRLALESGDATGLLRAEAALAGLDGEKRRVAGLGERDELRRRLTAAVSMIEQLVRRDPVNNPPGFQSLIERTLGEAHAALETTTRFDDESHPELLCGSLRAWAEALEGIRKVVPAEANGRAEERHRVAEQLGDRLLSGVASAGGELPASMSSGTPSEVLSELQATWAEGGPPFFEAVRRSHELIAATNEQSRGFQDRSREQLISCAGNLEDVLRRVQSSVPTRLLFEARLSLEAVSGTASRIDPDEHRALEKSLTRHKEALIAAERHSQRRKVNRDAALSEDLDERVTLLLTIASRREARALGAIQNALPEASGAQLVELKALLDHLGDSMERSRRDRAGRAIHAAGGRFSRKSSAPDGDAPPRVAALSVAALQAREVTDGEDIVAIHEAADGLEAALLQASPLRRPWVKIAGIALVAALIAAAVLVWRRPVGPKPYTLDFDMEPGSAETRGKVDVRFAKDGYFVPSLEQVEHDPLKPLKVSLPPGRYEVFVGDEFTGVVIVSPKPPFEANGIPLPAH